ncbi:MAG: DUF5060 domain-containing protein [Verrucomicrobia bacterium]|nr:DUF5060 domain-containing protein [Verrucomicrobiota bacterium]
MINRRIKTVCVLCAAMLISGMACLCVAEQTALELESGLENVEQYKLIDFRIRTDRIYANPFDPGEVKVSLDICVPGGEDVTIPAFSTR